MKISEITVEKIKNRILEGDLPEIYELEKVIENNAWHNNDSVFNHTLTTMGELENLFIIFNDKHIQDYLTRRIDTLFRRDALRLAALFHDIGKKETYKKEGNDTACPEHEAIGAVNARPILIRLGLSDNETDFICELIRYHGVIHEILDCPDNNPNEKLAALNKDHPDIFFDLILLVIADMSASQLAANNQPEFCLRMDFLEQAIINYFQ